MSGKPSKKPNPICFIEDGVRRWIVPLTQGKVTIVDEYVPMPTMGIFNTVPN